MATPLAATYRIHVPYISGGRPHSLRHYCRLATSGTHPLIHVRSGDTGIDWRDAATRLAGNISNSLPSGASIGTLLLEQLIGLTWVAVDSASPGTITFSGTLYPATQATCVLRDTAFKKVRAELLDINYPAPAHWPGVPSGTGTGGLINWTTGYTVAAASPDDPYNWMVGRSNSFLQDNPIAGLTVDLNDRIRRDAGLV